jgi:AAA domain
MQLSAGIRDIEAQAVKPVCVVVDTLSATMSGGEENGAGMSQFLANCLRIANCLDCFALAVHHVGHNAEGRERGHSSLKSNVDTRIFCQKPERLKASVIFRKVKDGDDNIAFDLGLEVIPFGLDEDGDPITTLAVVSAEQVDADAKPIKKAAVPAQERLLRDMVEQAMVDTGYECRPLPGGPKLKVVIEEAIRERYYARLAEKAEPGEAPELVTARQQKAFRRLLNSALKAKRLFAAIHAGQPVIWFP